MRLRQLAITDDSGIWGYGSHRGYRRQRAILGYVATGATGATGDNGQSWFMRLPGLPGLPELPVTTGVLSYGLPATTGNPGLYGYWCYQSDRRQRTILGYWFTGATAATGNNGGSWIIRQMTYSWNKNPTSARTVGVITYT